MGVLTPTFVDGWDELIIRNGTRSIIRLICRDQKSYLSPRRCELI